MDSYKLRKETLLRHFITHYFRVYMRVVININTVIDSKRPLTDSWFMKHASLSYATIGAFVVMEHILILYSKP